MSAIKISGMLEKTLWATYASAYDDLARYYKPYKDVINAAEAGIVSGVLPGRALDAGCGTGELSLRLIRRSFSVDALDISRAMLSVFRKKLRPLEPGFKLKIRRGDLNRKLPYPSSCFDAVASIHALFMLDDKIAAVREFDRVLKPGGLLVISHNRPVLVGSLFGVELKENGITGLAVNFIRLFRVGIINLLLSRLHRKIYGITPVSDIITYMKEKGYKLLKKRVMYRGFDDFIVLRKGRKK